MTKSNQILDAEELLRGDFDITFSPYWQRIEKLLKRAHITLSIIFIVMLGTIIIRDFSYFTFRTDEIFITILSLPIPFAFILFIRQFQKFRKRDFKEKITNGRILRVLIFSSILILFSAIVFALSLLVFLFLVFLLFSGSPDPEGIGLLAIYTMTSLLSGFQTFYLGYSILYLIEYKKQKKQYV
ncbi:MAG: hypothetical protein ACPG19_05295 [Saprospiraceae bacterium]